MEDLVLQLNNAGGKWSVEDTLEHICGSPPSTCEAVVHPLEKRIGLRADPLTVKELREELKLKHQKMNGGKCGSSSGDQEEEVGFFAGGFKGKCNNCGKQGHKMKDCRSPGGGAHSGNKNKANVNVECHHCHEKGHHKSDCPKSKKKLEKEKASAALEKSDEDEVCLTAMSLKELNDIALRMNTCSEQEVFVADSGALIHLSGSLKGMLNLNGLEK